MATPCRGDTPAQRERLRRSEYGCNERHALRPHGFGRPPIRTWSRHLERIKLAGRLEDRSVVGRVKDERDDADGRRDVLEAQPIAVRGRHDPRAQLRERGCLPRPDVLSWKGRGFADQLVVLHGEIGLVGAEGVGLLEAKQLGEPRRARRRRRARHDGLQGSGARMQGRRRGQ